MDKKEALLKLLGQFSEEEINELLSSKKEDKDDDGVFTINKDKKRRRGKGKRKRGNNKNQENKDSNFVNKFDDMMGNISLSSDERKELDQASKADKDATVNPLRGKRNKAEKVSIKCSSCHKDFKVYPSSIYNKDRWRCNACISGR
tara:strand:- start:2062 stop:2499 length:438 start_codon:yes stop_codon:yes gene_type:complete